MRADLDGVLVGEEVDDLERMRNDTQRKELLAVVAALHHEAVDETLDDGHLRLLELLLCVPPGRVREIDSVPDLDIVDQGHVLDLNAVPSVSVIDESDEVYASWRTHSADSHLPKSFAEPSGASDDGRGISAGSVRAAMVLREEGNGRGVLSARARFWWKRAC